MPIIDLGTEFKGTGAADLSSLDQAGRDLCIEWPSDYRAYLMTQGGGEGFVGENYLVLWGSGELATFNREYEVATYAPGFVAFGGDGGGEAFAFDIRSDKPSVVILPLIGMNAADALAVAPDFTSFIERLKAGSVFD